MLFDSDTYKNKLHSIWKGEPHEEYDIESLIITSQVKNNLDMCDLLILHDIVNQQYIGDIDVWHFFKYNGCRMDPCYMNIMARILLYMSNYIPCVEEIPLINGCCRIYKHPKCVFAVWNEGDTLSYMYVYDQILYEKKEFYFVADMEEYIIANMSKPHCEIFEYICDNIKKIPDNMIYIYIKMVLLSAIKQPKSAMK